MGSDWSWGLHFSDHRPPAAVSSEFIDLARRHGLSMRNESGTVTVFGDDGDHVFITEAETPTAVAAGMRHIALWLGEVDIFAHCQREPDQAGDGIRLSWSLDSVWCHRNPTPLADGYRHLHRRLTALWVDAAETLGALHGRVTDEWSIEQIWDMTDLMDDSMTPGQWPSWLGWWTYFGAAHVSGLPPLPLPRLQQHLQPTPSGGQILTLLVDPAAVDTIRYEQLHKVWLSSLPPPGNGDMYGMV
ncbi:hypothetical protein F4553_008036 [Allocatelliglobosispora scoriae]|uniref:Uncharacterized protein n=1 Tax=Allocatelliglobosispora scoriae TaxID=643052 RepID=A0A841C692_9ACTN|nr:hypothetical protein [Allocatelliglobosispora scoriae]MBB5874602.1 hypothetical protein [Allocatelliglobosispora scoriae]